MPPAAASEDSIAVIGAGPAGLATSRAFARLEIPHVLYEKHSDVGGIWDIGNPGSPMYESAHFISSRFTAGFGGFPMPQDYPDYPSHHQVLRYIRRFAEAYDLRRHGVFNALVQRIEPQADGWQVALADGRVARHRAIVCANGVTWLPNLPQWPGEFSGEIRHSASYRRAAVSVRRGYHFVPKHLHGWPTDLYFRQPESLPPELRQIDVRAAMRAITGDPARWGMPVPDHQLGQSHTLMNSQLLHHLSHGDITIRPDIARLDGDAVVFTDGSRMVVDLILAATGYQVRAPYLDDALFALRGQRIQQYMGVFHRQRHTLFTVGLAEVAAGIYPLLDEMAHLLAQHLDDQRRRPEAARAFEQWKQQDDFNPRGKTQLIDTDRHANYLDLAAYRQHAAALCRRFGWPAFDARQFERGAVASAPA